MPQRKPFAYGFVGGRGRSQKPPGDRSRMSALTSTGWTSLTVGHVAGLQAVLDSKQALNAKGSASGYATLDGNGFVPVAQIPLAAPRWVRYNVGYAALSKNAMTNAVTLFALAAGGAIHAVHVNPITAFTGGVVASATISVGTGGSPLKYCTALSIFTVALQTPQAILGIESMSAPTNIIATAVTTVGNLDALTQGSVDIFVLQSALS